jgi:hypothetical protein
LNSNEGSVSRTSSVASRASLLSGTITPEVKVAGVMSLVVVDIFESPLNFSARSIPKAV